MNESEDSLGDIIFSTKILSYLLTLNKHIILIELYVMMKDNISNIYIKNHHK